MKVFKLDLVLYVDIMDILTNLNASKSKSKIQTKG